MREKTHPHDFVVIGGGLSGMAAAVTAARLGLRVALVQDRPVPGGNASKEIRVPPVGARSCNFAYSGETGIAQEWLLDNLRRNPTCSAEGWNLVLLDSLRSTPNLDVFLNTSVLDVAPDAAGARLSAVRAYTTDAETWRRFEAPFFADCTGDGVVAALAGAPFRRGVEARSEFGEDMAADEALDHQMGCTIEFHAHDTGRPVEFLKPAWAVHEFDEASLGPHRPIIHEFQQQRGGFWWIEFGSDHDAIHDAALIRDELTGIVCSVWDFLKNRSTLKDELRTWEIDWIAPIAGRRESRRVEGDHILTQNDIESQRAFPDAVAYGGWFLDHHNPGGIFAEIPSDNRYLPGPYNIPLRSLYCRAVENLFLAGRDISVTHYGLSSTRVMLTCVQTGEAVGAAAAQCVAEGIVPRALAADARRCRALQTRLQRLDHHIHAVPYEDDAELGRRARVTASSVWPGGTMDGSSATCDLAEARLWQFPLGGDRLEALSVLLDATDASTLEYAIHEGPENGSGYPAGLLAEGTVDVAPGERQWVRLPAGVAVGRPGWHFLEVRANPALRVHYKTGAPTGHLAMVPRPHDPIRLNPHSAWRVFRPSNLHDPWSLDKEAPQRASEDPWDGMLAAAYCLRIEPETSVYGPENVVNPWDRPTNLPNLWISEESDFASPEWLAFEWEAPTRLGRAQLLFDPALDNHVSSLWHAYPRDTIPSIVRAARLLARVDGEWREVARTEDNHRRRVDWTFEAVETTAARVEILGTNGLNRAQVYAARFYAG